MSLPSVEPMIDALTEQLNLYRTLVDLSRRKRDLLVKGGAAEFEAIVESEQALLWQAGRLEERRFALQTRVAREMGLIPEDLTVSRLAPHVGEPAGSQLRSLQSDILRALAELGEVNEVNTKLIKQSLTYINAALQMVTAGGQRPAAYTPRGQTLSLGDRLKVLNRKV
ncbi:MAG: flagellar protein FlgN [Symbiobacteriia bacterium]